MTGNTPVTTLTWHSRVKGLARSVIDFVLPPICAHCKKPGSLLCAECRAIIPWLAEPICGHCGRSVPRPMSRCPACRYRALSPLQNVRAAVLFADPIPGLIHQLKYNNLPALATPLAEMMVQAWTEWQQPVDLVLSIPLHAERQKKRGYNQSDLLVQHLCRELNLETHLNALKRARNTRPQVGLSAADRQQNVRGAFVAVPEYVQDKRILLVDDVCTTGNTLVSAAIALKAAGAGQVSGYCLARAMQS